MEVVGPVAVEAGPVLEVAWVAGLSGRTLSNDTVAKGVCKQPPWRPGKCAGP